MNKLLAVLFATTLFAASIHAAPLAVGTQELLLQGEIDLDGPGGTEISLEGGYGYFIADYLEIGGVAGISDSDLSTSYSLAGFAEYNFELVYEGVVPFVGGQIGFASYDVEPIGSQSAMIFGGYTGIKIFITENMAITPRFKIELATDDIYPEENKLNDVDMAIDLGLRYFF